ncbi:MAG TPA: succinate dehydrogenase [Casimicrobiaceae bacterium]|nr:succinate dehydrogenase [Casimicrobiaceae bacterium]
MIANAMTAARRNDVRAREHPAYWAFVVMRLSGLALAAFLPVHFWALSHALGGVGSLEGFLAWTRQPWVKIGETALVLALAAHLAAGVRLLFVEFVGWRAETQKSAIAIAGAVAIALALLFALNV